MTTTPTSGAADLRTALVEACRAINSMKVEAETAAQGDEQMMLEACETISNEGLQADMAIRAALASTPAQPVAEPADTVVLNAAMRAIQQAIELIGAPTDERMRAVRRVLRGAVVVAEDSGDIPAQPDCLTCNDHGAVGNILTAEPCPDCTPTPQAAQQAPAGAAERLVQRMEDWTDARYIAELENVVRLLRRELEKLHRVREVLSDCSAGQPCSTCPNKKACQRGCIRQEEFVSTEYHARQVAAPAAPPTPQAADTGATAEPYGWLYDWTHSSATGRPDTTYTGFTKYEAHARKHDNCTPVYTAPHPALSVGWQPIETAPKDGTPLLLRSKKGRIADGAWITATSSCGGWTWAYVNLEPIEWQPLPVEPSMDGESNG